jgi:hypothetical protein
LAQPLRVDYKIPFPNRDDDVKKNVTKHIHRMHETPYLLDHERSALAAAGQRRALRVHTASQPTKTLTEIIRIELEKS